MFANTQMKEATMNSPMTDERALKIMTDLLARKYTDSVYQIVLDYLDARLKAAQEPVAQAVACDAAAVERALVCRAFHEDGAQWPDAYSEDEQAMEREAMRGAFAAANCTTGPSAYCRACQAVGMSNCQHFDECSCATCITCHRPFNTPPPALPEVTDEDVAEACEHFDVWRAIVKGDKGDTYGRMLAALKSYRARLMAKAVPNG